jgi:hypothetical protein
LTSLKKKKLTPELMEAFNRLKDSFERISGQKIIFNQPLAKR